MATRAEVAALARVSPALVSYVINDGPRAVSPEARARIEAAIDALNYTPDPVASVLRGGSSRTVGLLIPDTVNPFYAELATEIQSQLFEQGRATVVGLTDDEISKETLLASSFFERRLDSVILVSSQARRFIDRANNTPTPLVVFGHADNVTNVMSVTVDHARDAMTAVEHLQSWGHRVIACITGPRQNPVATERVNGWRLQQERVGAPTNETLIAHSEVSVEGGIMGAKTLLTSAGLTASGLRPTAIFATSDVQALGTMFACAEMGLRVPDDISIMGTDGTKAAKYSVPALTTLRLPLHEVSRALVTAALQSQRPPAQMFRGNLVVGDSCARPNIPRQSGHG